MLILTKKDYQNQTKNAKVVKFQNFRNVAKNFTKFLGTAVCWGENYGGRKKVYKKILGEIFLGFFLFFENIFEYHFHISQFVPI